LNVFLRIGSVVTTSKNPSTAIRSASISDVKPARRM